MNIDRIYNYIPIVLIFLVVVSTIFLILTGNWNILLGFPGLVLLAFFIGCVLIIFLRKKGINTISFHKLARLNVSQRILRRLFVVVACGTLILVLLGLKDAPLYLILLITLCLCIILQILSKNVSAVAVIFEILFVCAIVVFPFVFSYEYHLLGTDLIYHSHYSQSIVNTGYLDEFKDSGSIYYAFPGLHISVAIASILFSYSSNVSLYIFMTLAFLGLSIFVYLLSKQIIPSTIIGLLALYIVILSESLSNAFTLITYAPAAYTIPLFFMLFYLIFRKNKYNNLQYFILAIPIVLCCLIAHHANHLALIGIILFLVFVDLVFIPLFSRFKNKEKKVLNYWVIILYVVICGSYLCYMYIYDSVYFIKEIFSISDGVGVSTTMVNNYFGDINIFDTIYSCLNYSQAWICIVPALIGMYILLTQHKGSQRHYLLGLFMLVFFVLFSNAAYAIPMLNGLMLIRYHAILTLFFSIGIAFGLVYLALHLQKKTKKSVIVPIFISIFCLLLLISPVLNYAAENDVLQPFEISKMVGGHQVSAHCDSREVLAGSTLSVYIPNKATICVDGDSSRYYSYIFTGRNQQSIGDLFTQELCESENYPYILLRNGALKKGTMRVGYYHGVSGNPNSEYGVYITWSSQIQNIFDRNTYRYNTIYNNGGVTVYEY